MKCFTTGLLIAGMFCLFQDSAEGGLTTAEKNMAQSIGRTLDNLMNLPTVHFKKSGGGAARRAFVGRKRQYLDFLLLLDSSGSIGASEFTKAKGASKVVVDYINNKAPLSPSGSRIGMIEFSEPRKTKVMFRLGQHDYAWQVKNAIDSVGYDHGGSTATALALSKAKTEFQQNGVSRNAKVVWILTDGKSNTGGSPILPANQLKSMGVTICAVAVGNRVNMGEIRAIASGNCVYHMTSFSSYKRVMEHALKTRGGGAPSPVIDAGFFSGIKF